MKKRDPFLKRIKAFKRPLWLQWSWFPKDEQPPTLSVFEIVLYLIAFFVAFYFFLAFNKIPCHTFSISAEILFKSRYIDTLLIENDTSIYFCTHTAKIVLQIPRTIVFAKDSFDVCSYEINEDRIKIENLDLVSDTTSTLQTGGMSQYWRAVFDNVADSFDKTFIMLKRNHELNETNFYRDELKGVIDFHVSDGIHQLNERLDNALYPNKRKQYSNQSNHIFSTFNPYKTKKELTEYWDSVFDNSTPLNLKHYSIFWDKNINHLRKKYNPKRVYERIEKRKKDVLFPKVEPDNSINDKWDNRYYFSLVSSVNKNIKKDKDEPFIDSLKINCFWTTKQSLKKYDKSMQGPAYSIESFTANNIFANPEQTHTFGTTDNPDLVSYVSILSPGWFNLYDISQGWYKILFETGSIDSTELKIDFLGATEFFPMKIEPDEKGSNYIKFTDPIKILQIRKEGLIFYAKFKELENRQIIRSFFVTAILSGLIIVFLTFLILSLYRGLRTIRR